MTIVISGGTGWLGRHLQQYFSQGNRVFILRRGIQENLHVASNLFVTENLQQPVDVLIHTAGSYGKNGESKEQIYEANLLYGHHILDWALNAGVKTFLNVSTALPASLNDYSASKKQFAIEAMNRCEKTSTIFLNCRCEYFYGLEDKNFLGIVARACLKNEDVPLTLGTQLRDFIYMNDLCNAFDLLLSPSLFNNSSRSLFVGSGEGVPVKAVVEYIHTLLKSKSRLLFGTVPLRESELMYSQRDISFLNSLGFRPKYNYQTGIADWFYKEGWL